MRLQEGKYICFVENGDPIYELVFELEEREQQWEELRPRGENKLFTVHEEDPEANGIKLLETLLEDSEEEESQNPSSKRSL